MNTIEAPDFHKSAKNEIVSMVNLKRTSSSDKNFQNLVSDLNNDLRARYNNTSYQFDVDIQVDNINTVVLGLINEDAVGCGCFKEIGTDTVEIKRMFVNPYFRGLGISSSILKELTIWANELGYTKVVLETGRQQKESINLYSKYGFEIIENFGPYSDMENSVCMIKNL